MTEIQTEIRIGAGPDQVWSVLTDFERHPQWDPFIQSITGKKSVGEKLTMRVQPPEGGGMTFKPRVLAFEPNQELRWKGKLLFRGLFDGEHYFKLRDNFDGTTTFVHGERFSGLLVGLFGKTLGKTKDGFVLLNEALKAECEGSGQSL